jgi:hypothetical protein
MTAGRFFVVSTGMITKPDVITYYMESQMVIKISVYRAA